MGASQRTKGHDFERKIARAFRKYFPDAKRGFQTRGGSAEEPDVMAGPFAVECKAQEKIPLSLKQSAIDQASEYADTHNLVGIAVTKADYQPVEVTINLVDLVDLMGGPTSRVYNVLVTLPLATFLPLWGPPCEDCEGCDCGETPTE